MSFGASWLRWNSRNSAEDANSVLQLKKVCPQDKLTFFAKDDETVLIVECTRGEKPGKKRMAPLIEKLKAIREPVHESIKQHYGRSAKLKVKFIIATRNISWGQTDLEKCKEAQISVIADNEINYYADLVRYLKRAARFQLLAHMFENTKVSGLARKVLATKGTMGGEKFYTFLIRPEELLKIAYVGHKASRDIENLATYQRMLTPARLKKIAKYINEGGKFPTNIVVNLKTSRSLQFDSKEKVGEVALGVLHLPSTYASAWVIDGQHRLYGYVYAKKSEGFKNDKSTIPVLAYENLPADKEMNLFVDINSKQVKVNAGLLVELYADLQWASSDPEKAFQALLSRVASRLNSDATSPLKERMVVAGKRKGSYRCLTPTSIKDGLRIARLLGSFSAGAIMPGPLSTTNAGMYEANLDKGLTVLSECLRLFKDQLPGHWDLGDASGGYLCTNNGIRALFHVIKDVSEHVRHTTGSDLSELPADDVVQHVSPYLQALVDFFASASDQDVLAFRSYGSSLTAVRRQSYGMEAHIHEKFPDFHPQGLQEYLDSRDEQGTKRAAEKVNSIQRKLFDFTIGSLKSHYGDQNEKWWVEGVPLRIRQDCRSRWEEGKQEGEVESRLYLINYVNISIDNWELVKDVISLDERDKDNKKQNTKWIKKLNDVRKITAHPERGILSRDQVAFVDEILEKFERKLLNRPM